MNTTLKTVMAWTAAMGLLAGVASASQKYDDDLIPGATAPTAKGRIKLVLKKASDGRLEIQVKKLARKASYEVIVNGVKVATVLTSGGGGGKVRFRSTPKSAKDLPLAFDPRGASIVVRSTTGDDVLTGTLVEDNPGDPGDVSCCLPDDSGPECEDRTPAECAAQGGTVSTATSCLPDPCGGPGTGGGDDDVICCLPDDTGVECEDRTPAECTAQGGVGVQGASCVPNPCAPTPPSDPDVQCCLPDVSNPGTFECEDRTASQCAGAGGVTVGAGVCAVGACDGLGARRGADDPARHDAGDDRGGHRRGGRR